MCHNVLDEGDFNLIGAEERQTMIRAARPVGTVMRLIRFAQTAEDLMTPDPIAVPLTATAREAASLLTERGLAAAPVVNNDGRPV
jgi:CBS domain-containing protein